MNTAKATSKVKPAASSAYVPGICNINKAEIARRRKTGYLGLGVFVIMAVPFLLLHVSQFIRILLFLPAYLGTIGFLQAYYKFCVGYGAAGKQNATDGDKEAQTIVDAAAKALDKKRTTTVNTQAALIAGLITVLVILIP
jgi:hypothetical protein